MTKRLESLVAIAALAFSVQALNQNQANAESLISPICTSQSPLALSHIPDERAMEIFAAALKEEFTPQFTNRLKSNYQMLLGFRVDLPPCPSQDSRIYRTLSYALYFDPNQLQTPNLYYQLNQGYKDQRLSDSWELKFEPDLQQISNDSLKKQIQATLNYDISWGLQRPKPKIFSNAVPTSQIINASHSSLHVTQLITVYPNDKLVIKGIYY